MADKTALSNITTRQKATIGIFAVVVIVIIWQVIGLFGSKTEAPTPPPSPAASASPAVSGAAPGATTPPGPRAPQQAQMAKQQPAPMSQRELELLKLQQETQAKYLEALNELQMLKVSREIAENNQAIMTAKLATITAQKNIVDLLAPPTPPPTTASYAKGLVTPAPTGTIVQGQPVPQGQVQPPEINYTVISVSQLQSKWSAVLGNQGNLYHVSIGDILPPDQARVISIDRSGVILEKAGVRKKVSLVPII